MHRQQGGHRSVEVAPLTFRGWHVCARCHRHKTTLDAILRSGSELVSLSDRLLRLLARRPRAFVTRASAVCIARRGAQIGTLGAPCKAGPRALTSALTLTHGRIHATGTARHSSGLSAVPSAAQPCVSKWDGPPAVHVREPRRMQARRDIDERAWVVQADWASWMGRTCDVR